MTCLIRVKNRTNIWHKQKSWEKLFLLLTVAAALVFCPVGNGAEKKEGVSTEVYLSRTGSIHEALDRLPKAGGVIFLESGVYEIARTITLNERRCIKICGMGGNETPVPAPGTPEGTVIRWTGEEGGTLFLLRGVENFSMEDLTLDGNNKKCEIGIDIHTSAPIDTSSLLFDRMGIAYFRTGIKIGAPAESNNDCSVISDITFRSNETGILFDACQAVGWRIENCHFIWHTKAAVHLRSGGGFLMTGSSFGLNTIDLDLSLVSDSITVLGCTFERDKGTSIKCTSPAGNPRMLVQIIGCRIDDNTPQQPLVVWQGQPHLLMQGNRVKNGMVVLDNVFKNAAVRPVHTFIANWFEEKGSGLKLNTPQVPESEYFVYSIANQTTDGEISGRIPSFGITRVTSKGPLSVHNIEQVSK